MHSLVFMCPPPFEQKLNTLSVNTAIFKHCNYTHTHTHISNNVVKIDIHLKRRCYVKVLWFEQHIKYYTDLNWLDWCFGYKQTHTHLHTYAYIYIYIHTHTHTHTHMFMFIGSLLKTLNSPVRYGCRIHLLYLCSGVRLSPPPVSWMWHLNNMMVRLQ